VTDESLSVSLKGEVINLLPLVLPSGYESHKAGANASEVRVPALHVPHSEYAPVGRGG
jgi:hypothetical protein